MEYNIIDFVNLLRQRMYVKFPYENDSINELKHITGNKNPKPDHIRDIAFMKNGINIINENLIVFDIGNEYAEKEYPYYHILEDSPVIRKAYKGTEKSKGSQAMIEDLGQRDYGIVSFNGKTFSKEYSKNVRGKRKSVIDNSTRYVRDSNGNVKKINRRADTYQNIHYQYIEKMLRDINPIMAMTFNMKYGRPQSNGLIEEYTMQEHNMPTMDFSQTTSFIEQIMGM